MRIAVQDPFFLFEEEPIGFYGSAIQYIKDFKPAIYLSEWRDIWTLYTRLQQLGCNPLSYKIIFSLSSLNRNADVLVNFNRSLSSRDVEVAKGFEGLKVSHLADYYQYPKRSSEALDKAGIDYILGTARHDKYCSFFRDYYPNYLDRVIPVPLGFSSKFTKRRAFDSRKSKCMLSPQRPVEFLCNPLDPERCKDYNLFFQGENVACPWIEELKRNPEEVGNLLSLTPTEDFVHNIASETAPKDLNEYMFFINDPGLFSYPNLRTFEGTASGALMVAPDHGCYRDIGFIDGINCILHEPGSKKDLKEKLEYYLSDLEQLTNMANEATHWMHTHFSEEAIASWLHQVFSELYRQKSSEAAYTSHLSSSEQSA